MKIKQLKKIIKENPWWLAAVQVYRSQGPPTLYYAISKFSLMMLDHISGGLFKKFLLLYVLF